VTAIPNEVALRRPANTPVRREPRTINGHVVTRQKRGLTVLGVFISLLVAFLLAGFLLSMLQQAS